MSSQQPRVRIAKPVRPNGVLPVPAPATLQEPRQSSVNPSNKPASASATRQKILIRRLPPGLTQLEFEDALGEGWRTGGDRVEWATYKPGKISKDPAKPSRPGRAYLYLKEAAFVALLGDKVRTTSFSDAKHSGNDSCLLGAPSAEFAPFQKFPNGRPRKDARQSTIDQDPEFIEFLESLTSPTNKSVTVDQENESTKPKEKVTITPLIQYLKEKKASKGKEAPHSAKGGKHARQDSKGSKAAVNASNKTTAAVASATTKKRKAQGGKVEQAARAAVKVLNKQADDAKSPASPPPSTAAAKAPSPSVVPKVTPNSTASAALAEKRRERGNASIAAKILQRDLGLGGGPVGRAGRGARGAKAGNVTAADATQQQSAVKPEQPATQAAPASGGKANASKTPPAASTTSKQAAGSPTTVSTNPAQKTRSPPTGPLASRNNTTAHARTAHPSTTSSPPQPPPTKPSTSTQAFLKHANPSQGITEPLLSTIFAPFGTIKKCEIDKKKGFAYIDFDSPESLQKAIKASPVKVAQGQVVVLERKTGGREHSGKNTGGGGGGGTTSSSNAGGKTGSPNNANRSGGGTTSATRGGSTGARGGSSARGRGSGRRGGTANAPASAPPAAPAKETTTLTDNNIPSASIAAPEPTTLPATPAAPGPS